MGWYVHIHVCIPDDDPAIAEVAKRHIPSVSEDRDAVAFLTSVASGQGRFGGPKGGCTLWGYVGNYVHRESFIDALRPFWMALFTEMDSYGDDAILFEHDRILVFTEEEQSDQMKATEISLDDKALAVKVYDCPFALGQY